MPPLRCATDFVRMGILFGQAVAVGAGGQSRVFFEQAVAVGHVVDGDGGARRFEGDGAGLQQFGDEPHLFAADVAVDGAARRLAEHAV